MTPEQIEALRVAAKRASPGPWVHTQFGVLKAGKFAEYTNGSAQEQIGMMCGASWMRDGEHHANADYVALANPAAILGLIAKVESLTVPQAPLTYTVDGVVMSPLEYIEYLHRQVAGERLRADQGWSRYESANTDRNDLRAAMVAPTIPAIPGMKEAES